MIKMSVSTIISKYRCFDFKLLMLLITKN